ncbi:HNH endonuclease [Sinorhizobium phage phiM7]|uniref:HNH endonuclease n=2 Tax=Emdodecavirus TaxID=1980937 RepID=S5MQ23_9CAUD|nr:HNH endonuclease [Sinorhizobium phage phiM12]YP_009601349.1 HNH endonuclease [Sinorhizobium phage phiM7]AGR47930.1 HNH endonuclease [Sinorhizobium phage phiM12]AKF12769.1 HNH endonuclease [Sinorhizobium phage phiM7]AKF13130.1 HNH endonuclease [Sinorhizobium phage phiM19]
MITQNEVRELIKYNPETGKLYWKYRSIDWFCDTKKMSATTNQKRWNHRYAGKECFTSLDQDGYYIGSINGVGYRSHRIIWLLVHGYFPEMIDHINGNTGDNRLINIRDVDKWENSKNQKLARNNTSGVAGVDYWANTTNTKKWVARISVNGKRKLLGYFSSMEEAAEARKAAEAEYGYHKNHGRI